MTITTGLTASVPLTLANLATTYGDAGMCLLAAV